MRFPLTLFALILAPLIAHAGDDSAAEKQTQYQQGASKVANKQDELSADVQQLTIEQTTPQVIALLNDVRKIMNETTDRLGKNDTGGDTIAAQTEVIEKIHAAAKEKQKQSGSGSGSAMMDMMERMMGKNPDGEKPGKGEKPGSKGGEGMKGLSNTRNDLTGGGASGKSEARRVPKAAGSAGHPLPEEFKKALDAYNRGAEQKAK
jgi:hypothetical protein